MLGNDQYGCCVEADTGHDLLFRTTVAGAPVVPTDQQILGLYAALTGFDKVAVDAGNTVSDSGTSESDMSAYLVTGGFLGHKADAVASVNPSDLVGIRWSVELFGSCRLGINLPASAQQQFDSGVPWDVVSDDGGIVGGHDVRVFRYRDDWFDVVSWGQLFPVSSAFLSKYLEEAHAELFYDWVQANGSSPGGFDLGVLASDLSSL